MGNEITRHLFIKSVDYASVHNIVSPTYLKKIAAHWSKALKQETLGSAVFHIY